jgi:membrane protease YdiL (CAAX protease family)
MMRLPIRLLKNPFFIFYVLLYVIVLLSLRAIEGFNLALPVFVLLIIGIGFSALVWWATKGTTPLTFPVKQPILECGVLVFYLLFGAGSFLAWGMNFIVSTFPAEPLRSLVVLAGKLIIFVLVPLLLFRWFWGYRLRDLTGLSFDRRQHLRVVLWLSLVPIPLQLMVGNGLSQIRQAELNLWQLAIGMLVAYVWLLVEVGLVEEIAFRVLLQSRLAALSRSEATGVILMVVFFGLTHAPGLYFRIGRTIEVIGPSPSPLMAVGYSILIISVTGFYLGILWARTKNLVVLMLVHAAFDVIPELADILEAWFV